MARWLVRLKGATMDLEALRRSFPDGDVRVVAEGGEFFLAGSRLEAEVEPWRARETAAGALDEFIAVVSVLWLAFERVTLGNIIREQDDGRRHEIGYVRGVARGRSQAWGRLDSATKPTVDRGRTEAQELLARAKGETHLYNALLVWGTCDDPTWPRLYRILEEIEGALKGRVDKMGLCTEGERTRFRRSANSAHAAGHDARHSDGRFEPPRNPMTLSEATAFVSRILKGGLRMQRQRG